MASSDTSLLDDITSVVKQRWATLLNGLALGLGLAALLYVLTPVSFRARTHMRVGTVDGMRPVVEPLTVAVEGADPSFWARVSERAGVEAGRLELNGVFHTHLVEVRSFSANVDDAVALADAAAEILVADQNELLGSMHVEAQARGANPGLSRPASWVGDGANAELWWPRPSPIFAGGAFLGLSFAGLVIAWRARAR